MHVPDGFLTAQTSLATAAVAAVGVGIALRGARVITPIVIRVVPLTLTKQEPWYRIPGRRPHFSLTVEDDLPLDKFRDGRPIPQASRALNSELLTHFERLLGRVAPEAGRIEPMRMFAI